MNTPNPPKGNLTKFSRLWFAALFFSTGLFAADLQPETAKAWGEYVVFTEARINRELGADQGFFAHDFLSPAETAKARRKILSGDIYSERIQTRNEEGKKIDIPKGLIHHWLGAILIPDAEIGEVVDLLQDYENFEKHFQEVDESHLLSVDGNVSHIFLKLRRKKIRTVHYNTEHEVELHKEAPDRASSRSVATRIAQLENPDTPEEREFPPGHDSGYLWRLNSYWRFKQVDEGVIVECESLSLSRGIPSAMKWFVDPFTRSIPKQTLEATLESIRTGLTRP
jgi:hypothetical protein